MMQVRKIAGVVAAGALLFAGSVVADGREDYYTQTSQLSYFNTPENARTIGMAGSSVATSSDSSSVVGNPAGLGFMKDADVSLTYARNNISGNDANTFADVQSEIDSGQVLAAMPIVPTLDGTPKYGNIGFGWTGFKADSDDSENTELKNYSLNLAYGKDLSDQLAVGYALAYNQNKIKAFSAPLVATAKLDDGVRQEIGAQYKASKATTYGVSTHYGFGSFDANVANMSESASIGSADIGNWGMDVGVGHTAGGTLYTASMDYNRYNNESDDFNAWSFRTGLERSLTDYLKGRLGYRYTALTNADFGYGNENSKYNAVSFGLGVQLAKHLMADYGAEYRASGDGDWLHSVTLSVPFSLCNN
jgi:hypothetical protein